MEKTSYIKNMAFIKKKKNNSLSYPSSQLVIAYGKAIEPSQQIQHEFWDHCMSLRIATVSGTKHNGVLSNKSMFKTVRYNVESRCSTIIYVQNC